MSIASDESRQRKFRQLQQTKSRAFLRERTAVEDSLDHIAARKGAQAHYRGVRDLHRAARIQNLEGIQRLIR